MRTVIRWFNMRPLRLFGGFLVFLSIGLLVFLVLMDIVAGLSNPYLGIVTYMILPAVLVFGLLLVPFDAWLRRRRAAHGEVTEYPVIDLCDPHQRNIAGFFVVSGVSVLVVMTVVTYKAVEFMDTTTFCGKVCHKVMLPELVAYNHSPHASVHCVECHIGPGAPWFVKAKLSGMPQMYHYVKQDYPRPIETPVKALRPSRDTCENCHWPREFYGNTLKTGIHFQEDEKNTRIVTSMVMRVGSGGVVGSGIHSHMVSEIEYLPATENHREIAKVSVKRPDGSVQEFVNPEHVGEIDKLSKEFNTRRMDCIDCHNRAAHDFQSFEIRLDKALTRQQIDPTLPFIKREAMRATGGNDSPLTEQDRDAAVQKIRKISSFYRSDYPDIYDARSKKIAESVKVIETVYLETAFPHMRVKPTTYPDWKTHQGCLRCHGVMVAADAKGRDPEIPAQCELCHTKPSRKDPAELFKRPWESDEE